ncbi:MAG TPA: hypothetical protein VK459_17285 [Polyangiaceae bacterium]|nr:hypothetical protein [Polyangiaceae bacterium]
MADHKISIEPRDGKWRAAIFVGKDLAYCPGVLGSHNEEGPWCEGFGDTPNGALRSLYRVIGEAYVGSLVVADILPDKAVG